MTKATRNEEESPLEIIIPEELVVEKEEKPKVIPPKPPISRSGPTFPQSHTFRGSQGGGMNNRQRPGRAAGRGR